MKKTLILGASLSLNRYSNMAIRKLKSYGSVVVAIGKVDGEVEGIIILSEKIPLEKVHTVTIYLNPVNQTMYYDYVVLLKPERVIFNPGSENKYFENILIENNIKFEHSCTLVLVNMGLY